MQGHRHARDAAPQRHACTPLTRLVVKEVRVHHQRLLQGAEAHDGQRHRRALRLQRAGSRVQTTLGVALAPRLRAGQRRRRALHWRALRMQGGGGDRGAHQTQAGVDRAIQDCTAARRAAQHTRIAHTPVLSLASPRAPAAPAAVADQPTSRSVSQHQPSCRHLLKLRLQRRYVCPHAHQRSRRVLSSVGARQEGGRRRHGCGQAARDAVR